MDSDRLAWRAIDRSQVPAWTRLVSAIVVADDEGEHVSEQDLTDHFADPRHDFPRGSVAVYDGAVMAGYGLVAPRITPDGTDNMRYNGGVHPDYRGRGLGASLLTWAATTAVIIHQDLHPGRPLILNTECLARNSRAVALFAAHGFRPVRWFTKMTCDLTAEPRPYPVPDGVQIVGFGPERSPDARLVRNEAFRDHWGSSELTPAEWEHFIGYDAFRPEYSFLAYAGTEPLGLVIGQEYDAHTQATGARDLYVALVGTRQPGRKRGIATALMSHSLRAARADGFTTTTLDVDAGSPSGAVGLYQRLGFEARDSWIIHKKPLVS